MLYSIGIFELLVAAACCLFVYYMLSRWRDTLRLIPGPRGLPLLGNALSLDLEKMHMQFYELAQKYGDVMKIYIFNQPVVILNSTEVCLDALIRNGPDVQGRLYLPRLKTIFSTNLVNMQFDDPRFTTMRRVSTKALKAYGPGIGHLERIIRETIQDTVDLIQEQDGSPIDTNELSVGYIGCVIGSLLFGEKCSYNDPTCQTLHQLNVDIIDAADPLGEGSILDIFPWLFKFKFLFKATHKNLKRVAKETDEFLTFRLNEARRTFDKNDMRGCMDYFLEAQKEEVNEAGEPLLDDECLKGLLIDFVLAGTETSVNSLSQVFLDLLHEPELQQKIQNEIDSKFEPNHVFTLSDREKLPFLDAFLLESLRYLSQLPFLVPHTTIRDTEIGGYKIPSGVRVLMNGFYTAHNPDVYDEPFKVKPERFLDEDGNVVPPGHPARHNFIGFGAGRRICIGELLAKSRIFLFLANILQKFTLEPIGELPSRDVRSYKNRLLISPPPVSAKFVRRQQ